MILHDQTTIVTRQDQIMVSGIRGCFELKARGIDYLHGQLKKVLQTGVETRQLFLEFPKSHHDLLTSYLTGLRKAGALDYGESNPMSAPLIYPENTRDNLIFRDQLEGWRRCFAVGRVDENLAAEHDIAVFLIAETEMGRALTMMQRLRSKPCHVGLLALELQPGEGVQEAFQTHRAFFETLVKLGAHHYRESGYGASFSIHRVNPLTRECRKLFYSDGLISENSGEEENILTPLRVIQPSHLEQLPVASMTASHAFFPFTHTCFGLNPERLERKLTHSVVASCFRTWSPDFCMNVAHPHGKSDSLPISEACVKRWFAAGSRNDLILEALQDRLGEMFSVQDYHRVEEDAHSRESRHLSANLEVLGWQGAVLQAKGPMGLHFFKLGDRVIASFIKQQGLYLALMHGLIQTCHNEENPMIDPAWDLFSDQNQREQILREALKQLPEWAPAMLLAKVNHWGSETWMGGMEHV